MGKKLFWFGDLVVSSISSCFLFRIAIPLLFKIVGSKIMYCFTPEGYHYEPPTRAEEINGAIALALFCLIPIIINIIGKCIFKEWKKNDILITIFFFLTGILMGIPLYTIIA